MKTEKKPGFSGGALEEERKLQVEEAKEDKVLLFVASETFWWQT